MGLGIAELMIALEEHFDLVLLTGGEKETRSILTLRDLIDSIVNVLNKRCKESRAECDLEAEVFESLRVKYADITGNAVEKVNRESSCYQGLSFRKRARLMKYLNSEYPEIQSLTGVQEDGCFVFVLETLTVAVLAIMAFVNTFFLLAFIVLFALVFYDLTGPGPFFGRSITVRLKHYGTLGNMARFIASKRTARHDKNGKPWTAETVAAAICNVIEREHGLKHDQIDLDMRLSELD